MSYWDTSALVKLYLREPDSAQFEALASAANRVVTCGFARHEARTVFRRRESERAIAPGEADTLYQLLIGDIASGNIVSIPESAGVEATLALVLETCLTQSPPVFIRTLDAWHLASARVAGETEFVTADLRQRVAARVMGFGLRPF